LRFLQVGFANSAFLKWVFPATAAMAIFLACPLMSTFTIGALDKAAAIGLSNGAVFKRGPNTSPSPSVV
jgi:MFS transporter, NNP family, nitrate/nitrite transporter